MGGRRRKKDAEREGGGEDKMFRRMQIGERMNDAEEEREEEGC